MFVQYGDSRHRPVRVRGLRVREPAADVPGGLRVTPRLSAAPLPRPRAGESPTHTIHRRYSNSIASAF